jgi:hypothetical protein
MASKMFAAIGVRIDWRRHMRDCAPGDGSIAIDLAYKTPQGKFPGAFAYALPYEGTHIVVFFDRILETAGRGRAAFLLAYVLVHEITHIVQGVVRHSTSGIMKAQWESGDCFDMTGQRVVFAPEDVRLIYQGLDRRQFRLAEAAGSQQ